MKGSDFDPTGLRADLEQAYDQIFTKRDPIDEAIKVLVNAKKWRREADKVRADPELSAEVDRRLAEIVASLDGKTGQEPSK